MLNLREGANKAVFTVRSEEATQEVTAMIYFWSRLTKIVISDIDGTITKSDLLGHILPIVGRDWSHSGEFSITQSLSLEAASGLTCWERCDVRHCAAVFQHSRERLPHPLSLFTFHRASQSYSRLYLYTAPRRRLATRGTHDSSLDHAEYRSGLASSPCLCGCVGSGVHVTQRTS